MIPGWESTEESLKQSHLKGYTSQRRRGGSVDQESRSEPVNQDHFPIPDQTLLPNPLGLHFLPLPNKLRQSDVLSTWSA